MVKSLLLLINFTHDFTHSSGKMARALEQIEQNNVINHTNEAILWCRRHQIPIVHMYTGFQENYIDLPIHSPIFKRVKELGALKMGSWGCQIHEEIFTDPSDTIIPKHRISCFYGTELEQILTTHSINTLLIGGISTSAEVELTVREAHDRDYHSIVLSNTCAANNEANHLIALETISHYCKVKEVADLINAG